LATLGEILRETRESRGISLAEAERGTKIRQKYIAALEDDNLAALPGPVYARGFVRNYASYLGLDPQEIIRIFDEQSQPTREKIKAARGQPVRKGPAPPGVEKISIQPLSPEPIDTRVRYGSSYIAVSLLALPLLIAFYFVYSAYYWRSNEVPIPTVVARPPTVTSIPIPTVVVGGPVTGDFNTPTVYTPQSLASPQPTNTALAQPTETTPASANVVVKIVTTRDAWLRVLVDGVQQYNGTLPRGSTRQWTGRNTIRIRTGRADSVQVTVNGKDLGFMGTRNNLIVEKEWNRTGAERIIQR
jgi:transcriptional regulator with XRE-family HTH domain